MLYLKNGIQVNHIIENPQPKGEMEKGLTSTAFLFFLFLGMEKTLEKSSRPPVYLDFVS